jgi:hypothetical protein
MPAQNGSLLRAERGRTILMSITTEGRPRHSSPRDAILDEE